MRNKANCPKRGTEAVSRLRISDCGLGTDLRPARRPAAPDLPKPAAQTNPISSRVDPEIGVPGEPGVRNKPNFPAGPGGPRPEGRGHDCAKQTQFPPSRTPGAPDRAKQSQFLAVPGGTRPGERRHGVLYKQTQFPPSGTGARPGDGGATPAGVRFGRRACLVSAFAVGWYSLWLFVFRELTGGTISKSPF